MDLTSDPPVEWADFAAGGYALTGEERDMQTKTDDRGNGTQPIPEESVALVRREDAQVSPYEPTSYEQALTMARVFAMSKLTRAQSPEQAFLIMATGRELGVPATTALRAIHVIEGTPTLSADLMVALCLRSPACEYFDCVEATNETATYATKRRGREERRQTFTMADAKRAGLGDKPSSNWAKYPSRMLMHRAASQLAREVYPDILAGFYTSDEAEETTSTRPIIDAEIVSLRQPPEPATPAAEPPAAPIPDLAKLAADIETMLRACTSAEEAKPLAAQIRSSFAEGSPERVRLAALLAERKAAKWAAEPPHDPQTGEVREPGMEG